MPERTLLPLWIVKLPEYKAMQKDLEKVRNNSSDHDPALNVPLKAMLRVTFFGAVYYVARAYVLVEDFVNLRSLPSSACQTV